MEYYTRGPSECYKHKKEITGLSPEKEAAKFLIHVYNLRNYKSWETNNLARYLQDQSL